MEEYKKSCNDELLWKDVDQLHVSVLQMSRSCFEYKKICVGFLAAILTFIVKFTEDSLDHSLFVVGILVCMGFWISDANAYYFQRKTRKVLDEKMIALAELNGCSESYVRSITQASIWKSFFNSSMALYMFLTLSGFIGWALYCLGVINK